MMSNMDNEIINSLKISYGQKPAINCSGVSNYLKSVEESQQDNTDEQEENKKE